MTAELQRCRDEQIRFAALLLASGSLQNPPTAYQFGLRMAATDAFTDEILMLTEQPATLHTESDGRGFESLLRSDLGASAPTFTPSTPTP